jgi:hypothetical protein
MRRPAAPARQSKAATKATTNAGPFLPVALVRRLWWTLLLLTCGAACLVLAALAAPLAAQAATAHAAQPPAVTDTGRGRETFVLLTGLVGGAAGFRRIRGPLVARGYRVTPLPTAGGSTAGVAQATPART